MKKTFRIVSRRQSCKNSFLSWTNFWLFDYKKPGYAKFAISYKLKIDLSSVISLQTHITASYLVRLKMINDAGEEYVATLGNRVVLQWREKLGLLLVPRRRLTCVGGEVISK